MIYRVPQEPPGRRTYVWRQLKARGAVYLQQAAAVLPDYPEQRQHLQTLAEWILTHEGDASLLETRSPNPEWERGLLARFNRARDEEYAEVAENVERLEDEIRRETRKQKFTFAELEDVEADWDKLQRWRLRIAARDTFGAPGAAEADAALERGRVALDEFAQLVYQHEGVQADRAPVGELPGRAASRPPSPPPRRTLDASR